MATISCRPLSFLCCLYLIIVICEASFGPSYEYSKYCNNSNGNYTANCIYHTNLDTLTSNTVIYWLLLFDIYPFYNEPTPISSLSYPPVPVPVPDVPCTVNTGITLPTRIFWFSQKRTSRYKLQSPYLCLLFSLLLFCSSLLAYILGGRKQGKSFYLVGREKLLVYEFVPNKSLDYFIFDPTKKAQLDWEKRYKIIRVKSDVFSFGKLVLEIVSGQKNYGSSLGENGEVLLSFAWRNWQEGTITNIIDPSLNNYSQNEMIRCIQIENLANRPTMTTVAHMLNSHSTTFPVPLKPAFFMDSETINLPNMLSQEVNSVATANKSVNEASISELCPR
ncbi:Cysteine-rich receptor-like protein kinase 29 [Glycine soja]